MRVGLVGWRGMVGSVLMERMEAEGDFELIEPVFFTTSQVGQPTPRGDSGVLLDARDLDQLEGLDAILTCQGGGYTEEVHPALRQRGWLGSWIDAASTLRMNDDAVIVLDPVNQSRIEQAHAAGVRDFIGGNCTVSLLLMAVAPLFREGWVEWLSTMTYQAASGAGAQALRELGEQTAYLGESVAPVLDRADASIGEIDRVFAEALRDPELPTTEIGQPLAGSLLPWVDREIEPGVSREEWKGYAEGNKILGLQPPVPIDGLCVRVAVTRCHAQALTIRLRSEVPLDEIAEVLASAHQWARVVPNEREASLEQLTPAAVTGRLEVPIGRLRKMRMGDRYLSAFTVGDQLLWGAAEPLRRVLRWLVER